MEIAGYEIIGEIGCGATATVYKARQVSLGRMVAIKILRPELREDPVSVAQFRLEANSVATLKHSNILWVHEAGEVEGRPYFVMEYVSGYSVGQWIARKGRLDASDALAVAESVARALKYAWERAGLIHCDIKPDNILVDEDGIVKVADFSGLSRDNLQPESELIRRFTIGTPNYMSPEQVSGLVDLDARADIYALGALLYHMVTGVLPFKDLSDEEAMRQQVAGYLPDPSDLVPHLPSPMVSLIEKLMVKDRNARPADWATVLGDIARVRAGRPPSPPLPLPGASTLKREVPQVFAPASGGGPSRPGVRRRIVLPEKPPDPEFPQSRRNRRKPFRFWLFWALLAIAGVSIYLFRDHWLPREPEMRPLPPAAPAPPPEEPPSNEPPVEPPAIPSPVESPSYPPTPEPPVAVVEPPAATEPEPPSPTLPPAEEPLPPPAPALAEEPPPALADPERFMAVVQLFANSAGFCQRRQFDAAAREVRRWREENPDSPYQDWIALEAEGLGRVSDALRRAVAGGPRAVGVRLEATPGFVGDVSALSATGVVTIDRRIGDIVGGVDIELLRLADADVERILRAAAPEIWPASAAAWAIAQGQFSRAAEAMARIGGEEAARLKAWLELRQRMQREAAAAQTLTDARWLVQANRFREALALLQRGREALADTHVFGTARRAEWTELERFAAEEAGRAPATPPAAVPAPPTPPPGGGEDVGDEGDTVLIRDLRQRPAAYHGKTIRLRFRTRGPVEVIGGNRYSSTLSSDDGVVQVEIPEEGLRWFNRLPEFAFNAPSRFAYGVYDSERDVLTLIGRTRRIPLGSRNVEYSW